MKVIVTSGHRDKTDEELADQFVSGLTSNCLVLVGGAEGWDISVINKCIEYGIKYELHLPFRSSRRKLTEQQLYNATEIFIHKEKWESPSDNWVPIARNHEMIDRADELHVYWDKRQKGGTVDAFHYGNSLNIPVINWFDLELVEIEEEEDFWV